MSTSLNRSGVGFSPGRVPRASYVTVVGISIAALWLSSGCQPRARPGIHKAPATGPIRAIWVTRWDYKSPSDIAVIMENCKAAGFNTVLFQVRGNGTAFYRSKIEPWADELGGRDPGFDPLKVACEEAHRRGLGLHAWVNVMPGWRGKKPPANPRQLYHAHPDWFWHDASGRREPLGWYNSLNPCYPEVRSYIVAVLREIVTRYPVDGLHMDYIRFPNEWNSAYGPTRRVPDYPRDPRTVELFRRATGHRPSSAPGLWSGWRTEQVNRLVRNVRSMVRKVRPQVALSAAVGASPDEAKREHFQDARRWINEGLLDLVFPMNYTSDTQAFTKTLSTWSDVRRRVPVVVGIMFDKRDGKTVIAQIRGSLRNTPHFAAFAYNSLFERLDRRGRPAPDAQSADRTRLRESAIPFLRRLAFRSS
ncbi:MAG: family 10 glycosylhydrolase [Phycisphaerae bacterium]